MNSLITIFQPEQRDVLRKKARAVDFATADLKRLEKTAAGMIKIMKRQKGVGLAAPQINDSRRIIVISKTAESKMTRDLVMINPEILASSATVVDIEEGCLSLPGVYGIVTRPDKVKIKYHDLSGQENVLDAEDFLARVNQHEIDHLDGILLIDRTDRLTKGRELLI